MECTLVPIFYIEDSRAFHSIHRRNNQHVVVATLTMNYSNLENCIEGQVKCRTNYRRFFLMNKLAIYFLNGPTPYTCCHLAPSPISLVPRFWIVPTWYFSPPRHYHLHLLDVVIGVVAF